MERAKCFLIILLFYCIPLNAQKDYKTVIYNAYINNNMSKWKSEIDEMQAWKSKTNEFILELINYQYGYIAWSIAKDKTDDAETYLALAMENLEYLEKLNYKLSYINSYKSAFYGFKIGLAWYKAPILGPESIIFSKTAIETDKSNPYGYIQYANAQYYMPEIFGGSKTLAIEYYKKAQVIMEKNKYYTHKNWNYLSLLTTIAQAFTGNMNYYLAKEYYEKIIQLEPNYTWVKNELYPELLKKIKNNE